MAKNNNAEAQGFVIFHDLEEDVQELDNEIAGLLFKACFSYSRLSKDVIGNLNDKLERSVWRRLKKQIDYGKERRKVTCERNKENSMYAAYKRKAKEKGVVPLSKDDWLEEYGGAVLLTDAERYQVAPSGAHIEIEHENEIEIKNDTEKETEWSFFDSAPLSTFQQELDFEDKRAAAMRMVEGLNDGMA